MTPTKGKTWTALMLAASTLALTSLPATAQEATTEEDAATSGVTAEGTVDPLLLEEGAEAEAGTEVAADDAATDTDATVTAEGEATGDAAAEETDLAAEDGTLDAEGDATTTAEGETTGDAAADEETDLAADEGTTEAEGDATVTAEEGAAEAEGDETLTAEGEETEADGEATITAEGDSGADDAEAEGTVVVEGQEADENGVVTVQGTDAQDGTELAADDAATTGDDAETDLAAEDDAMDAGEDVEMAAEDEAMEDAETATAAAGAADTGAMMADAGEVASPPGTPNADMQAVLDKLAELGAEPLSTLSVEAARSQPTPADAAMAVMEDRGIEMPAEFAGILTRDITYPGADGSEIAARVYTPPEGEGPFPLIVYYHGGGWVIAGIDVYDASARALAAGANAVVVSATYRQAPEATFPAQHEDANAAYEWIVENSGEFNADAERLAVAGESAGGNLAINVAIHARDAALVEPDHILSVYPIASDNMELPSYETYADAMPLSREGMMWFFDHVFADPSEAADPRIDLIERTDLQGLPPVTIVNAEIDPLQSEGEILAARLEEAGVAVEQMTYPGVTHEFFGMGTVVPEAQQAVDMAVANLREAFEAGTAEGLTNDATADAGADTETTGEMTDVEATAAESSDAMATEGEDAMEMEGTAEPMEGEAATADN